MKILLFALMLIGSIAGYATGELSTLGLFSGIGISATFLPAIKGVARETVVFTEGLCEIIQDALINVYKQKAPELARTKCGYLDALRSTQNMAGVEMIPFPSETGKTRTVRLTYIKRGCGKN